MFSTNRETFNLICKWTYAYILESLQAVRHLINGEVPQNIVVYAQNGLGRFHLPNSLCVEKIMGARDIKNSPCMNTKNVWVVS